MSDLVAQQDEPAPDNLEDLAAQINQAHGQVEQAFESAVENALTAGKLLLVAKKQVKHGEFEAWIEGNFEFSSRLARAYMRVAKKLPELPGEKWQRVANMSLRGILKLLASPMDEQSEPAGSRVIKLANANTEDLVAELATRDPGEAEEALLTLLRKWADDAGKEIIVRSRSEAESETFDHTPADGAEEDLLCIPPYLDRRGEAGGHKSRRRNLAPTPKPGEQ
jgi:hypothetical protein